MKNFLEIANYLKSGTISQSLIIYNNNVKLEFKTTKDAREYLNNLNNFLYIYYLVKFNNDLFSFYESRKLLIKKTSNIYSLIHLGEDIIIGYLGISNSTVNTNDHELIEKCLNYINENFRKKITLKTVSAKLHISRNYLCHLFKLKTGYKFCEYINMQRINLAKQLIEENKKTFEFISFECGFSSQSHFSTTFKNYVGMTPNEYKKQKIKTRY